MAKNIRDVSPFLQKFRDFLLGRSCTLALRFEQDLATRSPPPPELPGGSAHLLSANYYYTRDGRREVVPPEVVFSGQQLIETGEAAPAVRPVTSRAPGQVFHWD